MIGTLLNFGGIVLGGGAGLLAAKPLPAVWQQRLKLWLAGLTVIVAFTLVWRHLRGPVGHAAGLLGIALLSLSVGSLLGQLLGLQRGLNRLGQFARERFHQFNQPGGSGTVGDGFVTCSVLFCATPLAVVGAVLEGTTGNWHALALKALLDGLAALGCVALFRSGPLFAAFPVLAWQGTLTLAGRAVAPTLSEAAQDALGLTSGFILATLSLVVLDLRKVPLANYLPALALAPLLARWWLG